MSLPYTRPAPPLRQNLYFCTSKASKLMSLPYTRRAPQPRQDLYFCTSKARKLRTCSPHCLFDVPQNFAHALGVRHEEEAVLVDDCLALPARLSCTSWTQLLSTSFSIFLAVGSLSLVVDYPKNLTRSSSDLLPPLERLPALLFELLALLPPWRLSASCTL